MSWKKTKIGKFLFEREGRFKPNDKSLLNLNRLEKIDFSGNFHIGQKASRTDMILIKRGDFVISGINVSKGAMGIYRESSDITATIHYSSYTFDESKIDINYFEHFLQSAEFVRLLEDQVKGGIKTEIKAKHLLNLEIYLPSLDQQKQIAEKLKHSEEKQKLLKQQIDNQKTNLKNLRKQILQDAIEGKLTKEWREKNPDVESASELLKKIKREKEKLISEKKIKKEKPLPSINESEIPFELPENWVWTRLGEICYKIHYGFNASAKKEKDGVRLLRITDIQDSKVDWHNVPGCYYSEKDIETYGLNENDIVIARTGGTIGKSFLVKNKIVESLFASYLIRLIPSKLSLSEYIKLFLETPIYWKQLFNAAWGAGQPNVNGSSLQKLFFPLPPVAEQHAIVSKLQTLMQKLDEAEKQIENSLETSKLLTKAILAEAFKNEG